MPVIATMNRIDHLRDKLRDIEQRLLTAYVDDLSAGTFVEYTIDNQRKIGQIMNHAHLLPGRCWIVERDSDRQYLLDCARIERVVAPEHAQQRLSDAADDERLPFDDSPEQLSIGTYDQYGMHPELQFEQLDDETPQPRGLRPGKLKDRRHRAYRDRRY